MPEFQEVKLEPTGEAMEEECKDWLKEMTTFPEDSKEPNEVYKLYLVYKYVKKGFKKEELKDLRWDGPNRGPGLKASKNILKYFGGDVKKAAQAVLEIGTYFDEKFTGPWSMMAIYNRLTDWEEGRLGR